MKNLLILLTILFCGLFATNSFAWETPPSPAPQSAILDQAGALSTEAHSRLDNELKTIRENSANEIGVLILNSLDGEDISDVGYATAKSWGIGAKGTDNGVLVVLAIKDRKSRIEVGRGVDGDLPDIAAKDILSDVLKPYMRKRDVEGGLSATFTAISNKIQDNRSGVISNKTENGVNDDGRIALIFIGIFMFVVVVFGIICLYLNDKRNNKLLTKYVPYTPIYKKPNDSTFAPLPIDYGYSSKTNKSSSTSSSSNKSSTYESPSYDPPSSPFSSGGFGGGSDFGGGDFGGGSDFGGGDFGGGGSSGDW